MPLAALLHLVVCLFVVPLSLPPSPLSPPSPVVVLVLVVGCRVPPVGRALVVRLAPP